METKYRIEQPKISGYLIHEATKSKIAVYKPVGKFKILMIKWCFGLKYKNI